MSIEEHQIFSVLHWYLNPFDLLRLTRVSRFLKNLVENASLRWHRICIHEKIDIVGEDAMKSWIEKRKEGRLLASRLSFVVPRCKSETKRGNIAVIDEWEFDYWENRLNEERSRLVEKGEITTKVNEKWMFPPKFRELNRVASRKTSSQCCAYWWHIFSISLEGAVYFLRKHEFLLLPFFMDARKLFLYNCSSVQTTEEIFWISPNFDSFVKRPQELWPYYENAWMDVKEWENPSVMKDRWNIKTIGLEKWIEAFLAYTRSNSRASFSNKWQKFG